MEKITSTTNETVKNTAKLGQKKYREEEGLFLVEGEKAVIGLYESGFEIYSLFMEDSLQNKFSNINCPKKYIVNESVLSKISTTKSPCKIVAVAKQKKYKIENFLLASKLLLLENIKDAGNFGTILRSCKAFNVDGILLLGETIDFYNPKVVRASVGCFDIPTINISYNDFSKFKNFKIYSTALYEDSISLKQVEFKTPFIIAFGSEAEGLSNVFFKNCKNTTNIKIEMKKDVESLNLATAVSVCLYKSFIKT